MSSHTDRRFLVGLALLGGLYVLLIVAMLVADLTHTSLGHLLDALDNPQIRSAIWLSLLSCSLSAIVSVWIGVPLGYLLARTRFWGRPIVDLILEVPIVLPPIVVGLSLLILFQTAPGRAVQQVIPVTYAVPSIVVAQVAVAAAFVVRTMRVTFEQTSPRTEDVARTLGCSRGQAFWRVTLPEAWPGVLTAFTLAWARSLGEFGPILIFTGVERETQVLSTTVFLELRGGTLEAALGVAVLMIAISVIVLAVTRAIGSRGAP